MTYKPWKGLLVIAIAVGAGVWTGDRYHAASLVGMGFVAAVCWATYGEIPE